MGDLRVPMASATAAFGLPVTVTRPAPDNTPVPTTGVWIPDDFVRGVGLNEHRPFGTDFQRREPRRLMAVTRDDQLSTLPRGTFILAPEQAGDVAKIWTVDGFERVEADCWRVILVPSQNT